MKISEIKYERMDQQEVVSRLKGYEQRFVEAKSAAEQKQCYDEMQKYIEDVMTMEAVGYIRFTLDTRDEFYSKEKDYFDSIMPILGNRLNEMGKRMLDSPYRAELEKLYPSVFFKNLEIDRKSMDKSVVPMMIEDNKVTTEYTKLMSSVKVNFRGEELPVSALRKYFFDEDRSVREGAMVALGKEYETKAEKIDDIYDRMVNIREKTAETLGLKDYVELGYLRMTRNCYDRNDIAKFRGYVKKYVVPLVCELKAKVASDLNIDKMKLYDNEVYTKKEPKPQGTVQQIFENGVKMYDELSEETGKLIRIMLDSEAFDVIAREGKWNGGYCTSLPTYKLPFILANFNGSSGDIDVLTHEFGHALAFYNSFDIDNPALRSPTMETAEVHSMSMEFFAYPWMELFFGDSANDYRFAHTASALTFLPYGTIVDYFQEKVYENPQMSKSERLALWKELEAEFRPYMDAEGIPFFEDGRFWQKQGHIFENPFYYVDYCLAQVTAFQFLGLMRKDFKKAFEIYLKFLKQGGTKTFLDLLQSVGLKSPFEEDTFRELVETVRNELHL